jgi:metal-dependent HD superfamily phosphatase/phosphodiesterase
MIPSPAAGAAGEEASKGLTPVKEADPVKPATVTEPLDKVSTVTLDDVREHEGVKTFIALADRYLGRIGYTEHGFRHAGLVSKISYNVLQRLGFDERMSELGAIAGYLHDMGNFVSRSMHSQTGATITYDLLRELGMSYGEVGVVMAAIGNHEEEFGHAVNPVGAALIVADKSDVHRSRVREKDRQQFDIHDRVNYAVDHSFLRVDAEAHTLTLELSIDTELAGVMEYFEIFLSRMTMCRRAAEFLDCRFKIDINGAQLL